MSRRVATITLNPAYDLVGFTPEIERGEVNLVRTTGLHAAGKGINVAKVLKDPALTSPSAVSSVKTTRRLSAAVQRAGDRQPFPGGAGPDPYQR